MHDTELCNLLRAHRRKLRIVPLDAALGMDHPGNSVQQCRLARAVASDQADDLPLLDTDVNALQCFDLTIVRMQIFNCQHRRHLPDRPR